MCSRHWIALLIVALVGVMARPGDASPKRTKPKLIRGGGKNASGLFQAGTDGATWSLPKGGRIEAGAGAQLRIFNKPQGLMLEPPKRTPTYTVVLIRGLVQADVGEGRSAVLVSGRGRLNAIVKRGSMAFASTKQSSAVASLGGDVITATRGAYSKLARSQALELAPDRTTTTRALLPAPRVSLDSHVVFAPSNGARLTGLRWTPVAKAAAYLVDVRGSNLKHPIVTTVRGTPLAAPIGPLPPGHYTVRVRAVEPSGLPGHSAAPTRITVVGAELPAGGRVDEQGVVLIGQGQTVRFSPLDGLDVATGRDGRFRRSTGAVTLRQPQGTSVFFKVPGTLSVARAEIEPRGIRAEIEFAPKNPKWPRHAVRARVRLRAKRPQALDGISPKIRVSLGIEEIEAIPEQHGDSYVVSVKPRSGRGPWVLRVEVQDQFGVQLGRSFVEIIQQAAPKPKKSRVRPSRR